MTRCILLLILFAGCGNVTGRASLPVILLPGDDFTPDQLWAIEKAVMFWQKELGETAVSLDLIGDGLVVPLIKTSLDDGNLGIAALRTMPTGCLWSAAIYVDKRILKDDDMLLLEWVVAHELGHVFGLDHNTNVSLMYPIAVPWAKFITEDDKDLLDSLYQTRECH